MAAASPERNPPRMGFALIVSYFKEDSIISMTSHGQCSEKREAQENIS